MTPPRRLTYEETCKTLADLGLVEPNANLRVGDTMPTPDDDPQTGISLFRTVLEGETLEGLSLPRTFICRSSIRKSSFNVSNLSESWLCWNDFTEATFLACDLRKCDFRSSILESVNFSDSILSGADFRHATLRDCNFANATMDGTVIPRSLRKSVQLSDSQQKQVRWVWFNGKEPVGG